MLVDANLLIYAVHEGSAQHQVASSWLTEALNGSRRVGLPWQSLTAFMRIATHPRVFDRPLEPAVAWARIEDWLASPVAWIPAPGPRFAALLGQLVTAHDIRGNLVPDAMLAALALEHGLVVCSNDTDFARFAGLRWTNPLV
jgi:uncharacterized protein